MPSPSLNVLFSEQVYVRVLIALLYEYDTTDQRVVQFWTNRPLNAPSYAMANQVSCLIF